MERLNFYDVGGGVKVLVLGLVPRKPTIFCRVAVYYLQVGLRRGQSSMPRA